MICLIFILHSILIFTEIFFTLQAMSDVWKLYIWNRNLRNQLRRWRSRQFACVNKREYIVLFPYACGRLCIRSAGTVSRGNDKKLRNGSDRPLLTVFFFDGSQRAGRDVVMLRVVVCRFYFYITLSLFFRHSRSTISFIILHTSGYSVRYQRKNLKCLRKGGHGTKNHR